MTEVLERKLFDTLSREEKRNYYRSEFSGSKYFQEIFSDKERAEFHLDGHAEVLREEICRLLKQKKS